LRRLLSRPDDALPKAVSQPLPESWEAVARCNTSHKITEPVTLMNTNTAPLSSVVIKPVTLKGVTADLAGQSRDRCERQCRVDISR
jgi:hypothetical protein